jgi:hypothetical protein
LYENNIVYAVHIDNVYPNSIGILSIPDYGDTDDIDEIDDIDDDNETNVEATATKTTRTTGTRTYTNQISWLQNSEIWRCDTAVSNNTTTRWDNASEPELLEPVLPPVVTATCSVCAAVLGFVVVDPPPPSSSSSSSSSFFYADGTVSPSPPSVLAFQLLKHQLVVLLPKQRQQEPINSSSPTEITTSTKDHPDSSNNCDCSDDDTVTQDPTMAPETSLPTNILATPPLTLTYSYGNILSLSQFIIHEMIRYAETKAVFTWVLICQENNMMVESNQMVTKKTTTMLRLRLLHWNTIAASSDDCHKRTIMSLWKSSTTDLPKTITNDPQVGDNDDDQEDDDVEFVVVQVPQWKKRVKVWYETMVTTTTQTIATTTTTKEPTGNMNHPSTTHGKQYPWNTRKSSSAAAIHRSKRNSRMEDWYCRIPSSPRPQQLPRTRTTDCHHQRNISRRRCSSF